MSNLLLSCAEIIELTGKRYRPAQIRVLMALSIAHAVRPDGEILVLRALVEEHLGRKQRRRSAREPNWDALKPANK